MKIILLLQLILILTACSRHETKNHYDLKDAMAYGVMRELNSIDSGKNRDLLVRLYQVPLFGGDCFIETHGICQYKYYLSVSTFDELPEVNVFELKHFGEVKAIKWLQEEQHDYAEIELTLNRFTKEALKNNSALANIETKILLKFDTKNVIEEVR